METTTHVIESNVPFSESLIWQLNRNFYQEKGIDAWREGIVAHHLTSNSMVGKTYAELIFAFLKDTVNNTNPEDCVYILELGTGHGRLAFHILKHLERLIELTDLQLPPFCYVLSDIAESNLEFLQNHPQLQTYFERGILDLTYFDAVAGNDIHLRYSNKKILPGDLKQPLIALANYFFDSIPTDLFHIENTKISACSVTLKTKETPKPKEDWTTVKDLNLTFQDNPINVPHYDNNTLNEILEDYKELVFGTYLFFPHSGLQCLDRLRKFSKQGLMMLSMDKGYHETHDLENRNSPEIIKHGSFSVWVNYHAFQAYCKKMGGTSYFPNASTFHLQVGCLLLLPDEDTHNETSTAYQRFVNDFGPDDFNGLKRLSYQHIATLNLSEILSILRLSAYDYGVFKNLLPRIKQVSKRVTYNERARIKQTVDKTWNMYFSLDESQDLASEIGGILYDLGFYEDSLQYFQFSKNMYGDKPDVYYNRALCFYQLRKDKAFIKVLAEGKQKFPNFQEFSHLDKLDLNAD